MVQAQPLREWMKIYIVEAYDTAKGMSSFQYRYHLLKLDLSELGIVVGLESPQSQALNA